jgi:hypothetical protein
MRHSLKWTLLVAVATFLIGTFLLGWLAERVGAEAVRLWLELANIIAVVTATVIAYQQLRLLVRQQRQAYKKSRRNHALSYSLTHKPRTLTALQDLDDYAREQGWASPVPIAKMLNVETGEPVAKDVPIRGLEFILAHWTNLALTVGARATDEDMAFEMAGALLVDFVDRYEAYITYWQTKHPRAYEHLLDLRNRWKERLRAEQEAGVPRQFLPSELPAWKP